MQKSIRRLSVFSFVLVLALVLAGCGPKLIETFSFKESSYELTEGDEVKVELNLDEIVDQTLIVYASANSKVATFVDGTLKAVKAGETTISISYKDENNDLTVSIPVKVKLTAEEQAKVDAAKAYDAKVEALSSYTSKDVEALKALVDELETLDLGVLNYVTKGDQAIEMYDKARALVIDEMIDAIPDTVAVTDEKVIEEARAAYQAAENNVRKHVSKLEELQAKEDALAKAIYDATPDSVTLKYETESYTTINGNLVITAKTAKEDPNTVLVWTSSDPTVATVVDGVVTGVKPGTALITATIQGSDVKMTLGITVIDNNLSEALQFVLDSHNSYSFYKRRLPIGSGTPNYYYDVLGSVNNILFKEIDIKDEYLAQGNADSEKYLRADYNANVEFVTVHYTANFQAGAKPNANYMSSDHGGSGVSIHYVTGNDGVYHCLDDQLYGAWHAGDSNSRYYSNSEEYDSSGKYKLFSWIPTGVKYDGTDLLDVVFTASDDFYYEINGQKTTIKLPETYNYKDRKTNHTFNADGTVSSVEGFRSPFVNVDVESFFNDQSFPIKVENGEYYMGSTWWSYGQVYEGRICSAGGNINSIGIESCVDKGSNLWYTWQLTAQLVAQLMEENNLGIERVKGHHFFDGKDCPQPMLENDLQVWWEFLELIETEYEKRTKFADYEFTLVAENSTYVHKHGYVKKLAAEAQSVGYTVTVTKDGQSEQITLYTWIPAK
ncbi:MAG: N-acetylmuramoyl-L-alanine amidase [Bacilli bacterium]|nr:N-acetylmuramoyl-L-alanine amidase [Bacilli bacterium]